MAGIETFGTTAAGRDVQKITLRAGDLTASVLTWGAVLQSVRLAGVGYDLTQGSDRLADYEGDMRYHGSLIAPVVNRLTDAKAPVAGVIHGFEANFNGQHCLHSWAAGTHLKVWDLVSATETQAVLALDLADGEGGGAATPRPRRRGGAAGGAPAPPAPGTRGGAARKRKSRGPRAPRPPDVSEGGGRAAGGGVGQSPP